MLLDARFSLRLIRPWAEDGESTNFFCELPRQDTSWHVGVDDSEVAFNGTSGR